MFDRDDFVGAIGRSFKANFRDNTLIDNKGDTVAFLRGGNDTAVMRGGDDTVFAGNGDDDVRGGNGNDVIFGGNGNDTLRGGDGGDILVGGAGDDVLIAGLSGFGDPRNPRADIDDDFPVRIEGRGIGEPFVEFGGDDNEFFGAVMQLAYNDDGEAVVTDQGMTDGEVVDAHNIDVLEGGTGDDEFVIAALETRFDEDRGIDRGTISLVAITDYEAGEAIVDEGTGMDYTQFLRSGINGVDTENGALFALGIQDDDFNLAFIGVAAPGQTVQQVIDAVVIDADVV